MFYKNEYIKKMEIMLKKREEEVETLKSENRILMNKILSFEGISPIPTVSSVKIEEEMEHERIEKAKIQEQVFGEIDKVGELGA